MSSLRPVTAGWAVALAGVSLLAVLAVLPALVGDGGAVLHRAFAVVCHQITDRSPHLAGEPVALCHRCSGILGGLILGVASLPVAGRAVVQSVLRSRQGLGLALAVVPTALDWSLGALGVWANTPASRMLTGAAFGLAAGVVLAANLLVVSSPPTPVLTDA